MCFSFRHHRTILTYHAYPVCRCSPCVNARRALPLFHCVERQGTSTGFVLTDSNNNLNGGSATRVRGKLQQPSRASSGMAENHGSAGIIKKAVMASSAAPVGQTKAEARPPPSGPESLHRHVGGGPAGKATAASTEILDIDQRLNELQVRRVPGASPGRVRRVCGACMERVRSVCAVSTADTNLAHLTATGLTASLLTSWFLPLCWLPPPCVPLNSSLAFCTELLASCQERQAAACG